MEKMPILEKEVRKENWVYLKWPNDAKESKVNSMKADICNGQLKRFSAWVGDKTIEMNDLDVRQLSAVFNDLLLYLEKGEVENGSGKQIAIEKSERMLRPLSRVVRLPSICGCKE